MRGLQAYDGAVISLGANVGMDSYKSFDHSQEKLPSSRACFATVHQAPIDLPEQVLIMIVSRVRDVRPAAEADASSF